ncbi:MAG: TIGR00282 family metallophosphoesterase [Alphaproteobacteria bacterium]
MRLLFLGDLVGRAGRRAVSDHLPAVQQALKPDLTIANVENAAAGFGLTRKIMTDLFDKGVDVQTSGNHIFDQREIMAVMGEERRLLRPATFPKGAPGFGHGLYKTVRGKTVLVINLMGRVYMDAMGDPFAVADEILTQYRMGNTVDAVFVDFHGEATSEKMALGHHLDGRVSFVVGTHTHVPTADTQILPGGTGLQCDAGMCGDYNSVIGMQKDEPVRRFLQKTPGKRFEPANGDPTLCGVFVETDDKTGHAINVAPVRQGGSLLPQMPDF